MTYLIIAFGLAICFVSLIVLPVLIFANYLLHTIRANITATQKME